LLASPPGGLIIIAFNFPLPIFVISFAPSYTKVSDGKEAMDIKKTSKGRNIIITTKNLV